MRCLDVFIDHDCIGQLQEEGRWSFTYEHEWARSAISFDLSPALTRTRHVHVDDERNRHVQWYFENLLPEEALQHSIFKEAGIPGGDTFALLKYLGEESTGALNFREPGQELACDSGLRELSREQLSERITALGTRTMAAYSPKRVAVAGAQHKLLVVVMNDGRLFEPVGTTASTHILKPDHPESLRYPASAINEYIVMRLARAAGLEVPGVYLTYVPEPVYIVERFDRVARPPLNLSVSEQSADSVHVVDACQLLNIARTNKYLVATLTALQRLISLTTDQEQTRQALYRWLVFNVLIGNDDAHLKNLSFFVSNEGIKLTPHYDLLSTGPYATRAITNGDGWPWIDMTIGLPEARFFGQVRRANMLRAGCELGLSSSAASQILDDVLFRVTSALDAELDAVAQRHAALEGAARAYIAGEAHLMRIVRSTIWKEMAWRLSS